MVHSMSSVYPTTPSPQKRLKCSWVKSGVLGTWQQTHLGIFSTSKPCLVTFWFFLCGPTCCNWSDSSLLHFPRSKCQMLHACKCSTPCNSPLSHACKHPRAQFYGFRQIATAAGNACETLRLFCLFVCFTAVQPIS